MFQITQTVPVYCQVTDGLIGSRTARLPMTYGSLALARKLAERLAQDDYEGCGDSHFSVIDVATGRAPIHAVEDIRHWAGAVPLDDEIPF